MDKGTYVLIVEVKKPLKIRVGALGKMRFESGMYAYVGSAMSSLSKRIKRHLKKMKKLHWHVDYLTSSEDVEIKGVYVFYAKKREEEISMKFSQRYTGVNGFGASDMKRVNSNLYIVDDEVNDFILSLGGVKFEKAFSSDD